MECKTCKEKSKKSMNQQKQETIDINLIPESIQNGNYNGNFFFKLIAFFVILIALPLIILVLVGQIFMTFFLPKSLPKVTKKLKGFFMSILNGYAKFKYNREIKKRENQFSENVDYVEELKKDSEKNKDFDDIEIFEQKNNKKKK
jgi:hypothetical protein